MVAADEVQKVGFSSSGLGFHTADNHSIFNDDSGIPCEIQVWQGTDIKREIIANKVGKTFLILCVGNFVFSKSGNESSRHFFG